MYPRWWEPFLGVNSNVFYYLQTLNATIHFTQVRVNIISAIEINNRTISHLFSTNYLIYCTKSAKKKTKKKTLLFKNRDKKCDTNFFPIYIKKNVSTVPVKKGKSTIFTIDWLMSFSYLANCCCFHLLFDCDQREHLHHLPHPWAYPYQICWHF